MTITISFFYGSIRTAMRHDAVSTHSHNSRFTYQQTVLPKKVPDFGYLYSEDGIVGLAALTASFRDV